MVSWILGPGEKLLASQVGIGDSYHIKESENEFIYNCCFTNDLNSYKLHFHVNKCSNLLVSIIAIVNTVNVNYFLNSLL